MKKVVNLVKGGSVRHPEYGLGMFLRADGDKYIFGFHGRGVTVLKKTGLAVLETADITIGGKAISLKPEELMTDPDEVDTGVFDKNQYGRYDANVELANGLVLTGITIQMKNQGKVLANAVVTLNGILNIKGFTIWKGRTEGTLSLTVPQFPPKYVNVIDFNPNNHKSIALKKLLSAIEEAYKKELVE